MIVSFDRDTRKISAIARFWYCRETLKPTLDFLLETWRLHRQPEVADLAEAVTSAILATNPRAAIGATKKASDRSSWREIAALRDPLDFPRLMQAARGGSQIDVKLQVQYLSEWNHPSLAQGLLELLEKPPYAGIKSRPMLEEIFDALRNTRDIRLVKPARKLAKRYLSIVNSSTGGWIVSELERIAKVTEGLSIPALSADERAHLEKIVQSLPPAFRPKARISEQSGPDIEALLRAVYEHPDDDEKRLLYAEAIREEDAERAEFIQLQIQAARGQITKEQEARIKTIGTHAKLAGWAQPLSMSGYCEFARGFPNAIRLYAKTASSSIAEKAWLTIEAVDALGSLSQKTTVELLDHPNLVNVKKISNIPSKVLAALDQRARIWTTLTLSEDASLDAQLLGRVPHLRELKLHLCGGAASHDPTLLLNLQHLHTLVLHTSREANTVEVRVPPGVKEAFIHGNVALGVFAFAVKLERLLLWPERLEKAHLEGLTALKSLDVRAEDFGADALASLNDLRELKICLPRSNALLPQGLLSPLKQLRKLDLSYTHLTMGELAPLEELEELKNHWLDIDGVPALPRLQRFHCMLPRTVDEIKRFLARNPTVRDLDFCWNSSSELWFYGEPKPECVQPWEEFADALSRSAIDSWGDDGKMRVVRENGSWRIKLSEKSPLKDWGFHHFIKKIMEVFGIVREGIPAELLAHMKI